MPSIYLDGNKIEAKEGQTVIEAAYENGMKIPHFCWHPELSIAGNCRMCLVEIGMPKKLADGNFEKDSHGEMVVNYFPKLQIACATPVSDGMHIRSVSDKAVQAQEAVMEFLLINHPLDCPICDEAGECKLQDYAFKHSNGESRFVETKNKKPKRQKWGPNVYFDGERCIQCSRCIRFAQEVAGQDVLTFVNRNDHVTIKLFEGKEWNNPLSMNVIDICPVGALTSADFRFEARVWDMTFTDSITPADSTGNNIVIGVRNNAILRVSPKTNMYVNKYWITDNQRLNYKDFVNNNRITDPTLKNGETRENSTWDKAYSYAAMKLNAFKPGEIMLLGSPKAANEANYLLAKLAKEVIKTPNIDFLEHIDNSKEENEVESKDCAPNAAGAKALGIAPGEGGASASNLIDNINSGKIKALLAMEEFFDFHPQVLEVLHKLDFLCVMAYNHSPLTNLADLVLPASTYAEIEGTYTNRNKRVQHFHPAIVTKENRRHMGMNMSRLDKFGSYNDRWTTHEERNSRQSWRIIMGIANEMGAKWSFTNSESVFDDIAANVPAFKDMSYEKIDEYQGLVLFKGNEPDPKILNYQSHRYKADMLQHTYGFHHQKSINYHV